MRCVFAAAFAAWLIGSAHAAQAPSGTIAGLKLSAPPTIDGVVDLEKEWHDIPGGSGAFDEDTGEPAIEGMRFWLAYDEKYVYFAAVLEDSQPEAIRAVEYRTNASLGGDDHVELQIDPFGNFSDSHRFRVNPRGATDFSVPGGRANKREWQGEFQAAGRITASGWECEARIPWAVMRLPAPGTRTLRVNVSRELQRLNREFDWRDTSRGRPQNTGYWTDVEVPDVPRPRTILALPYGFAGIDEDGHALDAGLDLKTKLTDQIDGVMSFSPDFRNVENQILSLDFSYFERLAGESRPFFLEGQRFFGSGHGSQLFASQRIRRFDAGAKVFGKLTESTSIALLDTQEFGEQNSFAGRVSHAFGPRTDAYASFTNYDTPAAANSGAEVGFSTGWGSFSLYGSHMATQDSEQGYGYRHSGGMFFRDGIWSGSLNYSQTSGDLLPRLGFAPETGFKGYEGSLSYSRAYQVGPYQEIQIRASFADQTTIEGDPYRRGGSLSAEAVTRDGTEIQARVSDRRFRGFDDRTYSISVERPKGNPYNNWGLGYSWGRVGGVEFQSFGPEFSYRPNTKLQLRGSFEYFEREGTETQTVVSGNYDFDEYRAIAARLVQRDSEVSFYVALRQSGNTGNEYFLILGDPNSDSFRPSLILKAVFPVEIRF